MSKYKHNALSGELDVVGENEIHIELHKKPKEMFAIFSKEHEHHHHTPCNPKTRDEIRFHYCGFHKHHCLVIKWHVSNERKIFWEVIF